MNKENPYFEQTKQNYIEVEKLYKLGKAKHTSSKYRFLALAVKRQSEQFLFEAKTQKRKYWKFSRGSLIFVEFGVNIGGELSNNHWAIVLDKVDSPYKKTLTVIPLTSKNQIDTVLIDEVIAEYPSILLDEYIEKLHKELFAYLKYLDSNNAITEAALSDVYQAYTEQFSNEIIQPKIIDDDNLKRTQSEINDVIELTQYYKKYIKRSYAKCNNLQTISKDRILKKNRLDPIGKMKVSDNTLDKINEKLKELYLF